jgi:hypothetical protein
MLTNSTAPPAPTAPNRARNLFWPGFALGFLLLAALSCSAVVFLSGLDDLVELRTAGMVWTPPPLVVATPVLTPEAGIGDANPPGGAFRAGDEARNVTSSVVNIRRTPGHLGKPLGDIVAQAQPGEVVTIVEGPEAADNLTWWYVRYGAAEGWMAEATASGVQILGK